MPEIVPAKVLVSRLGDHLVPVRCHGHRRAAHPDRQPGPGDRARPQEGSGQRSADEAGGDEVLPIRRVVQPADVAALAGEQVRDVEAVVVRSRSELGGIRPQYLIWPLWTVSCPGE